jgi:pimeloyl-ACP methyl ester carboxylesterase
LDALKGYQLIIPDLRGHGRSTNPGAVFTFQQFAQDMFALLDYLGVKQYRAIGMSLGAEILLHMATKWPQRIEDMVLISATPYFPEQTRALMRQRTIASRDESEWQQMRAWHVHGDQQIKALFEMEHNFKDCYQDLNFTPAVLSTISARTLVVHGDRDPLFPVELALQLYQSIPHSYLWIVPNGGHIPIFGDIRQSFIDTTLAFLEQYE